MELQDPDPFFQEKNIRSPIPPFGAQEDGAYDDKDHEKPEEPNVLKLAMSLQRNWRRFQNAVPAENEKGEYISLMGDFWRWWASWKVRHLNGICQERQGCMVHAAMVNH